MNTSKKISLHFLFNLLFFLFLTSFAFGQIDVIEIDTITANASKGLPYNKPVTLKVRLQGEVVTNVYLIEKYKFYNLSETINHYAKKGSYELPEIPKQYYFTKKKVDTTHLYLTFSDRYLLKPSTGYYLVIVQAKADPLAFSFFDTYNRFIRNRNINDSISALTKLQELEVKMRALFGTLNLGYYTSDDYRNFHSFFRNSFMTHLDTPYTEFSQIITNHNNYINSQSTLLISQIPITDSLTHTQLFLDTTINKEVIHFLSSKDFLLTDLSTDLNTISINRRVSMLFSGKTTIGSLLSDTALETAYTKRVINIENSITQFNNLKKSFILLRPKYRSTTYLNNSINYCQSFINTLLASKDSLKKIIAKRKVIEEKISREKFALSNSTFRDFSLYSVVSGDSYLNFETRNKVLLTPDFGIVSSAITKNGKSLQYGIVPYLGFHINFMALDKDITFKSYKKNWKQYFSLMIGWSLVNMNQDSTYASLFEKSSLLTGIGVRLNNVVRITAGTQWLFKLGKDSDLNPTRKLTVMPYAGISFDLNVKQYLNGFIDIISGIGKTTAPKKSNTTSPQ